MQYLLIAATVKEVNPFLDHIKKNSHSKNSSIDILITGIGLTATTYSLTKQIQLKRPELVIQAGVGGGLDKKLPLGSVVVVGQETIADQSVIELNRLKTLFDLELLPHDQYPFNKGWLINPYRGMLKKTGLRIVKSVSVNEITTTEERIRFYKRKFGAEIESMEGAALHYVCLMEKIPFLQLRSTSNYIGERNKKNWNMSASIENLNQALIHILEKASSFKLHPSRI